jgi:hypothetical protein
MAKGSQEVQRSVANSIHTRRRNWFQPFRHRQKRIARLGCSGARRGQAGRHDAGANGRSNSDRVAPIAGGSYSRASRIWLQDDLGPCGKNQARAQRVTRTSSEKMPSMSSSSVYRENEDSAAFVTGRTSYWKSRQMGVPQSSPLPNNLHQTLGDTTVPLLALMI